MNVMFGPSATDAVSVRQIEPGLAIKTKVSNLLIASQQDLNLHRIGHDPRPVSKRVRGHGSDDECFDGRHQYRATGRKRIRSRAGRSGDDHSAAAEAANEYLVVVRMGGVEHGERARHYP